MSVTLSSAVKNNLAALQTISAQESQTQNILSTGKKVNSALDNATSFFTASSLNSRANSLTSLLNSVSNGIQTIQAANTGITSITKLVDQLKSTGQQALAASSAYTSQASYSLAAVSGATSADLRGVAGTATAGTATSTNAISSLTSAAAAVSTGTTSITDAVTGGLSSTDHLTISDGTNNIDLTYNSTPGAGKFNSIADIQAALTAANVKVAATDDGNGELVLTGTDKATNFTVGGAAATDLGVADASATAGSTLTIGDGANSQAFTFDTDAQAGDATKFKDFADLKTKLAATNVKATADVVGSGSTAKLKLTANDNTTTVTATGTGATALGGLSSIAPAPASGGLDGKTLTFSVGGGAGLAVKFGDPATTSGAVKSLDDLNSKLSTIGLSASVNSTGTISFKTTSDTASESFSVKADAAVAGLTTAAVDSSDPVRGGAGADSRDSLVTQYNGLLDQIDSLAKDSSYNGLNLLNGDTLSLVFNETNTSKLSITGTDGSSSGLGLSKVSATDFNDGDGINKVLSSLNTADNSLASESSKLGANLAVVQTRQDFTTNLANTLTTGADNLTNADMNAEATNLLALQTSQSLAQSALSLANQSAQGVLRLLQ